MPAVRYIRLIKLKESLKQLRLSTIKTKDSIPFWHTIRIRYDREFNVD